MKKLTAIAATLSVIIVWSAALHAQAPAVNNLFTTAQACVASLGKVPYYEPHYLGDVAKNPVDGEHKQAAPIEGDACVHMKTMQGWKWAPIKDGTVMRWNVSNDDVWTVYAHDKCGNDADDITYAPTPTLEPKLPEQAIAPTTPTPPTNAPATPAPTTPVVPCVFENGKLVDPTGDWANSDRRITTIERGCAGNTTKVVDEKVRPLTKEEREYNLKLAKIQADADERQRKADKEAADRAAKLRKAEIDATKPPSCGWFTGCPVSMIGGTNYGSIGGYANGGSGGYTPTANRPAGQNVCYDSRSNLPFPCR